MRHGKTHNHLGRKTAHRHAMLSNMAASLILHKRISTTVAKAKALRMYAEPLITKAKEDNTHNRRLVFSLLQSKEAVTELFGIVSEKVAARPGGYTRIIKLANRLGDNAEMCLIELVDFNEVMLATTAEKPVRTRRSRKASGGSAAVAKPEAKAAVVVAEESTEVADEVSTEVADEVAPTTEATNDKVVDETPDVSPEEKTEE